MSHVEDDPIERGVARQQGDDQDGGAAAGAAVAPRTETAHDDEYRRHETLAERADRNWNEVLQELRVTQTGAQILTGFLLSLAFQPSFQDLLPEQRNFYLFLVTLAGLAAIIALAPVAMHRFLFRTQQKDRTVAFGNVMLLTALVAVSVLIIGVVGFVFDVVTERNAAFIAAASFAGLVLVGWIAIPTVTRIRGRQRLVDGRSENERRGKSREVQ